MNLNVLHVINCMAGVGGAERLVLDLAHESPNQPVTVITWFGSDNSLLRQAGGEAVNLIPLSPFSVANLRRAVSAIKQADVGHFHLFPTIYIASLFPIARVYTEHSTWNRRRNRRWMRPIERWIYRRFQTVAVISEATEVSLCRWLGADMPTVIVIPNGIRLDRFKRKPRLPPSDGQFTVGMASRFAPEKDHATLIQALALLPSNFRLKLAADGALMAEARALASALSIADRVEFVGTVTDMNRYFDSIDLYVQSSVADGFSIVSVEAMAAGLPVIASNIDGLRDTIGRSDLLFTAGDPDALVAQIRRLQQNKSHYEEVAAFSVKRADQFSISRTAALYQTLYEQVFTERSTCPRVK